MNAYIASNGSILLCDLDCPAYIVVVPSTHPLTDTSGSSFTLNLLYCPPELRALAVGFSLDLSHVFG